MFKKSLIITVMTAASITAGGFALAAVTLDENKTTERADRRTVTDTVVKMDKTLADILVESQRTNELLEELLKKNGGVVPPRKTQ
ncbi:MAG: hypothetical protein K0R98_471 [Rickettsiaceae bacterium]|nr:hypothetical protein [Rickettsiaceae bacterium]